MIPDRFLSMINYTILYSVVSLTLFRNIRILLRNISCHSARTFLRELDKIGSELRALECPVLVLDILFFLDVLLYDWGDKLYHLASQMEKFLFYSSPLSFRVYSKSITQKEGLYNENISSKPQKNADFRFMIDRAFFVSFEF